jgi:DNA-binding LacI/PurR family transcriptional regulator
MVARPFATEPREVTMNDIARAAGVARSTVSRILNDVSTNVPVAPETRARVLEAARGLGYRPNPQARALRGAPTMLLGAIVRDITDPFFAGAIEALSTVARARDYNIVLGHAHAQANEALALAAMLEARQCDALVLLGDMRDQPALIEDLRLSRAPAVALWQGTELPGIAAVDVDNRCGIEQALAHLRSLGHHRIAFVGSRLQGDIRERREAFVGALALEGQPIELVGLEVANTPADGVAAVRALMALELPPTAVVASTDVIAAGILHGAAGLGLRVPDDLSVVGFDDIAMAAYFVPALTTIRMPTDVMVAAALDLALGTVGVSPDARSKEHRVFRPDLIVRASTAPPRSFKGPA